MIRTTLSIHYTEALPFREPPNDTTLSKYQKMHKIKTNNTHIAIYKKETKIGLKFNIETYIHNQKINSITIFQLA